jgi:GNAT superfamily N-acetyltransferase
MDDRSQPRLAFAIRPVRRTDAPGLADFYARLTPESRRCRFLGSSMPAAEFVSALAGEPGMVAALQGNGARNGEIVAHASVQLDGHHGAEVAFAVADELQGHGLGRRLVSRSLRLARELGADRASATLLAGNVQMRHLLTATGPVCADCLEAGTEEIVLDLRLPA